MKDLISIINEEISNFDFLGNDAQSKETENFDMLSNEDFQKKFICDSLIEKNKIKITVIDSTIGGNWEDGNDASKLTLYNFLNVEYNYDQTKEPAIFKIEFEGNDIAIDVFSNVDSGNYGNYSPPSGSEYYNYIQWNDINAKLFTTEGDEIDFIAFKKAPVKIQDLFVREYNEGFISNETLNTYKLKKDNIKSIPYC